MAPRCVIFALALSVSFWGILAHAQIGSSSTLATRTVVASGSALTLAVPAPDSLVVTTSTFSGNGGAVLVNTGGTFATDGDITFANNTATNTGGAIRLENNAVLNITSGSLSFLGNSASSGGGAIHATGTLSINTVGASPVGLRFSGNTSTNNGGALYANSGPILLSGTYGSDGITVSSNTATNLGGAFYSVQSATFNVATSGSIVFSNNTAGNGGALYIQQNLTFASPTPTPPSLVFSNNAATLSGGRGGAVSSGSTVSFANPVTFDGNSASIQGGALYVANGDIIFNNDAFITHNYLTSTTSISGVSPAGSGILAAGVGSRIVFNAGVLIASNTIGGTNTGGAVSGTNVLATIDFTSSTSTVTIRDNVGGGVNAPGGIHFAGNVIFSNNVGYGVNSGSAITFDADVTATANRPNGGSIAGNNILVNSNTATILLTSNSTVNFGGGMYGNYVTLSNTNGTLTITNNQAGGSGGAGLSVANRADIDTGLVLVESNTANSASGRGGAFYTAFLGGTYQQSIFFNNDNAVITMRNNSAGLDGGVLYVGGTLVVRGTSLFQNNASRTASGGAIAGHLITLSGAASFISNTALHHGGAISANADLTYAATGTISGNISTSATSLGGAFYSLRNIIITTPTNSTIPPPGADNIVIDSNRAGGNGGAFYSATSISIDTTNGGQNANGILSGSLAITANSSTNGNGGAFYSNAASGGISISGTFGGGIFINSNTTKTSGGAFYSSGTINISAVSDTSTLAISDNHSTGSGGALYASSSITVSGSYKNVLITGNGAAGSTGNGGAFNATSGAIKLNVAAQSTSVTGNTAGALGGAFYSGSNFTLTLASSATFSAINNQSGTGTMRSSGSSGGFLYVASGSMLFDIGPNSIATIGNATSITNNTDSIAAGFNIPLIKTGAGTLVLWGRNTYSGTTLASAGSLLVHGSLASAQTVAASGALLGGTGTLGGSAQILNGGTLAPGASPGTLTITGSLVLAPASHLAYELGQAKTVGGSLNDLTNIGGNLALGGTLDISVPTGGDFTPGWYRIFNYGTTSGSLSNPSGLILGSVPIGAPDPATSGSQSYYIQTSISKQVNLVYLGATPGNANYWDGPALTISGTAGASRNDGIIQGGSGTWQAFGASPIYGNDNWTSSDGSFNAPWQDYGHAIFAGTPGTVTIDNTLGPVTASGLTFLTPNYVISGGTSNNILTLGPASGTDSALIATGVGPAQVNAVISAHLIQSATAAEPLAITKTGLGMLFLTASNDYTGGTRIVEGTIEIQNAAALGSGTVSFVGSDASLVIQTGSIVFANDLASKTTTGGYLYILLTGTADTFRFANHGTSTDSFSGQAQFLRGTYTLEQGDFTQANVISRWFTVGADRSLIIVGTTSPSGDGANHVGGYDFLYGITRFDVSNTGTAAAGWIDAGHVIIAPAFSGSGTTYYSQIQIDPSRISFAPSTTPILQQDDLGASQKLLVRSGSDISGSVSNLQLVDLSGNIINSATVSTTSAIVQASNPLYPGSSGTTAIGSYTGITLAQTSTTIFLNSGSLTQLNLLTDKTTILDNDSPDPAGANQMKARIIGSGTLAIIASGTIALSASNSYTGGTIIHQGTLLASATANGGYALGSGQIYYDNPLGSALLLAANTTLTNRQVVLPGASGTLGTLGDTTTITAPSYTGNGGAVEIDAGGTLALEGDIIFSGNAATGIGGAIWMDTDAHLVTASGSTAFTGNTADTSGGAIASANALQITGNNTGLAFINNTAINGSGGALDSGGNISIEGNYGSSGITISSNTAGSNGGAFYATGTIFLNALSTGTLSITNNTGTGSGGAFWGVSGIALTGSYSDIIIANNKTSTNASYSGGALGTTQDILISATSPGSLSINNNSARGNGGALVATNTITLSGNYANVTLSGNSTNAQGGAIWAGGKAIIDANTTGTLSLSNNTAGGAAGAVYATGGINLTGNYGAIAINSNTASSGGALYAGGGTIAINAVIINGGTFTIANNRANDIDGVGGAFNARAITLGGDYGTLIVQSNTTSRNGGAFYASNNIIINATTTDTITIANNRSINGSGGALAANSNISLVSNATNGLNLVNNAAGNDGGAIYLSIGDLSLGATTGDILFSGNVSRTTSQPVANAIYLSNDNNTATITIDTNPGRTVRFLDPITSNLSAAVIPIIINGKVDTSGTVIFDGANYAPGTADVWSEIRASTLVFEGVMVLANNARYGVDDDATSYTLSTDGTLAITGTDTHLLAGGSYTQQGTFAIDIANRGADNPAVTATAAAINATTSTLDVTGFTTSGPFAHASDIPSGVITLIRTSAGISGTFANVLVNGSPLDSPDYIIGGAFKSTNNLDYDLGYALTWFTGITTAHGNFTLTNATDTFDLDTSLTDQSSLGTFASGWDGKSLTKLGLGTLILSASNAYTGTTTVSSGTLRATVDDALGRTVRLDIQNNATAEITSGSQAVGFVTSATNSALFVNGGTLVGSNTTTSWIINGSIDVSGSSYVDVGSNLNIGGLSNNTGTVTVRESGSATVAKNTFIAASPNSTGALILSDSAVWTAGSIMRLGIGDNSAGNLTLTDNARLNSGETNDIATGDNATGTVAMSGNSVWSSPFGNLRIGNGDSATGVFTMTGSATIVFGNVTIGQGNVASGTLTLDGNTTLSAAGNFHIGLIGSGNVILSDNAIINANFVTLAQGNSPQSSLTLNDNAHFTATNGISYSSGNGEVTLNGGLAQTLVVNGASTGTMIFNGGILQAMTDRANYINSFGATGLIIAGGGAYIDTNNHNIGIASDSALTGSGQLHKIGTGTLTLNSAQSNYTGGTEIHEGSLVLNALGTNSSSDFLGTGTLTIDSGATTHITQNLSSYGAYDYNNDLAGTGLLDVDLYSPTFTYNMNAASAGFTGTVNFHTATYTLGNDDFHNATLVSSLGNTVIVDTGSNHVAALTFNSGTVRFDLADNPTYPGYANGWIGAGTTTINSGAIQLDPNLLSVTSTTPLLLQDDFGAGSRILVQSATISGTITSLTLIDLEGNIITPTASSTSAIVQGGYTSLVGSSNSGTTALGTYASSGLSQTGSTIQFQTGILTDLTLSTTKTTILDNAVSRTSYPGIGDEMSANIHGTGTLWILGSGTGITLTGSNNNTGGIVINQGTLIAANPTNASWALGAANNTITFNSPNGSTLLFIATSTITQREIVSANASGTLTAAPGTSLTVTTPAISTFGGAVFVAATGTLVPVGNITFADNHGVVGGAIYFDGQDGLSLTGGTLAFTGNHADNGGALFSNANLTLTGTNAQTLIMRDNTATVTGGAIHMENSDFVTTGSYALIDFSGNSAAQGAAFFTDDGGRILLLADTGTLSITGNSADREGGAILADSMAIGGRHNDILITNNTAGTNGGAFDIAGGDMTITATATHLSITDNIADGNGGALYADGSITISGSYTESILISSNTASNNGGAIRVSENLTINPETTGTLMFTDNTAVNGRGGALYVESGTLVLGARTGDILFTGNQDSSGANAAYLANTTGNAAIALDATAGHTIRFLDPIASDLTSTVVPVLINASLSSTGTVAFSGENHAADSDDLWSQIRAATTISNGVMLLSNNARYGVDDVGTSFTVAPSGTLAITGTDTHLLAGGTYTQLGTFAIDITDRGSDNPAITATSATIESTTSILNLAGFGESGSFSRASDIPDDVITLIRTTNGISGTFSAVTINGSAANVTPDYLIGGAFKSIDNLDYNVGYALAWYTGSVTAHGNFTLTNAGDTFEVDIPLANQNSHAPFASDWDGQSLTKLGEGTLILSATNTYTGTTTVAEGTLRLAANRTVASSTAIHVAQNATLELAANQYLQNISGDGLITLGSNALIAFNNTDTVFSGTLDGTTVASGGFTKAGGNLLDMTGARFAVSTTSNNLTAVTITGGTLALGAPTITTTGSSSSGLLVQPNAMALISGVSGTIHATGPAASAVTANGANARIAFSGNQTVITDGERAQAITAAQGGLITFSGSARLVTTSTINEQLASTFSYGMYSFVGGTIDSTAADRIEVETHGGDSFGAYARDGGTINLGTYTTITTHGEGASAVEAEVFNASGDAPIITVSPSGTLTVTTTGAGANGIVAESFWDAHATVNLGALTDVTTGYAKGLFAVGNSSIHTDAGTVHIDTTDAAIDGAGVYVAGGRIDLGNNSTITTHGANTAGIRSSNLFDFNTFTFFTGTVEAIDSLQILTDGTNAHAVIAEIGGFVDLGSNASLRTSGDGSHGAVISDFGADILLYNNTTIVTTGSSAHAIRVELSPEGEAFGELGAQKTLDGTLGNTLPANISISGPGSAVLNVYGDTAILTLAENTALSTAMTLTPDTYGAKAEHYGVLEFIDNASSGGTRLWATDSGTIALLGISDAADSSRVTLDNSGVLDISGMPLKVAAIGSLDGDATALVNLGASNLVSGVTHFGADGTLLTTSTYAGRLTGAGGALTIATNTLTLTGSSDYTGGTEIDDGPTRLIITNGNAIGTGTAIVNGGLDLVYSGTYFNDTAGSGTTSITPSSTITITGNNADFTGQWNVAPTAYATATMAQNLGAAETHIDGQLHLASNSDWTYGNTLSGTGILSVDLDSTASNFAFSSQSTPSTFTGTVLLENASFTLLAESDNTRALANATLETTIGAIVNFGTNSPTASMQIHGLALNGGIFNVPMRSVDTAHVLTVDTLTADLANTELTMFNLGTNALLSGTQPSGNFLDQDDTSVGIQVIRATTLDVDGRQMGLLLSGTNPAPTTFVVDDGHGHNDVQATYRYIAVTSQHNPQGAGVYVDFLLTQLQSNSGLVINSSGANDHPLGARVTGTGFVEFQAASGAITLVNSLNDYTGATLITSGTLIAAEDHVLGDTTLLSLAPTTGVDLTMSTQTIGAVSTAGTSTLNLNSGTLEILTGGTINGALAGNNTATLVLSGGTLAINNASPALHASTTLAPAATAILADTQGLGNDTSIAISGTLILAPSNSQVAPFSPAISGPGSFIKTGNATATISRANDNFSGNATVQSGTLSLTNLSALGSVPISTATNATIEYLNVSGSLRNVLDGSGALAVTTSTLTIGHANTIANTVLTRSDVTLAAANALGGANATVRIDSGNLRLATNATLGAVTLANNPRIIFSAPASANGPFKTATLSSLAGTEGTFDMNLNFTGAGGLIAGGVSADYLVIAGSSGTATHTVSLHASGTAGADPLAIELIRTTDGTSTFLLAGGAFESGAYNYDLNRGDGSELTPDANRWYISSTGLSHGSDAILSTAALIGVDWHYDLDTLHQRLGDVRAENLSSQKKASPATNDNGSVTGNVWLRANSYRLNGNNNITGLGFDETVYGITGGADKAFESAVHATTLLGGFVGMGNIDRDFDNHGEGSSTFASAGLYATWMHNNGWYADLVFKATRYKNKIEARADDGTPTNAEYNSHVEGLSLEFGRRFQRGNGWWVEPFVQAAFARLASSSYTATSTIDSEAYDVHVESTTSAQYRAQVRFGREYRGSKWSPYAKFGVTKSDTDGGEVTIAEKPLTPSLDGWRAEVGFGTSYRINNYSQLYMDYEYAHAEDYERPWSINLGYRQLW